MKSISLKATIFVSILTTLVACGPETTSMTRSMTGSVGAVGADEDLAAPLGLTGVGDRVCRLKFSFLKKDAAGNFSVLSAGNETSDNVQRAGYGRGCLNYCVAAFDELRKNNEPKGTYIMVESCSFSTDGAAAKPAVPPKPVETPKPETRVCKLTQVDGVLILAVEKTRVDCSRECEAKAVSNPQRKCEWGSEVLREHPTNKCLIVGQGGKVHYENTTTRFVCRNECKAREVTNPFRTCLWGGENVTGK